MLCYLLLCLVKFQMGRIFHQQRLIIEDVGFGSQFTTRPFLGTHGETAEMRNGSVLASHPARICTLPSLVLHFFLLCSCVVLVLFLVPLLFFSCFLILLLFFFLSSFSLLEIRVHIRVPGIFVVASLALVVIFRLSLFFLFFIAFSCGLSWIREAKNHRNIFRSSRRPIWTRFFF